MLVHPVIPVSPETSARAGMKGLLRLGVPVTACVCSLRQGQKGGLLMQKINSEIMNTGRFTMFTLGRQGVPSGEFCEGGTVVTSLKMIEKKKKRKKKSNHILYI